jgi:hypothetical protein
MQAHQVILTVIIFDSRGASAMVRELQGRSF